VVISGTVEGPTLFSSTTTQRSLQLMSGVLACAGVMYLMHIISGDGRKQSQRAMLGLTLSRTSTYTQLTRQLPHVPRSP
jgi:hypothetical protein